MKIASARIVIVDTNRLFRAGLISLLGRDAADPIEEADDIDGLARLTGIGKEFDLVLLEARIPQSGAPCPAERARGLLPKARISMLADRFDAAQMRKCFGAGADGYLLKNISGDTLEASLRLMLLGEKILPSTLAELMMGDGCANGAVPDLPGERSPAAEILSERELEILRCLVNGDSNKRIANRLSIAEATVKVHLKNILRKTRAANRTQAAIWAVHRGLSGMAAAAMMCLSPEEISAITNCARIAASLCSL